MGRQQLALMPPDYLRDIGKEAFAAMKVAEPVEDNPVTNAYVQCIAGHITRASLQVYPEYAQDVEWEVVVFDNPVANAFAMPGYKIGVFSGLVELAEDEDQLAAVIGHEVAHLLANHGNERMTQEMGIGAILLLVGLFSDIDSQLVMQALGLGAEVGVMLPFSRVHESEADIIGQNLMSAAGFRPEASIALWENMAAASGERPFELLATHPGHETRIANLRDHLPAARDIAGAPVDCGSS